MDSYSSKQPQPLLEASAPNESIDIVAEPEAELETSYILEAFVPSNTRPHHLKAIGIFLMITAAALPVSIGFSGLSLPFIIVSVFFGLVQLILGIICYLSGIKIRSPRYLHNLALFLSVFLLVQLVYILLLESYGMYIVVDNNSSNCDEFTLNKVCDDRWGLMTVNILLIIFLPSLDVLYLIITATMHRMITHVSKNIHNESWRLGEESDNPSLN